MTRSSPTFLKSTSPGRWAPARSPKQVRRRRARGARQRQGAGLPEKPTGSGPRESERGAHEAARRVRSHPPAYGNVMPLIVMVRVPLTSQSFSVKAPVATSGVISASTNTVL